MMIYDLLQKTQRAITDARTSVPRSMAGTAAYADQSTFWERMEQVVIVSSGYYL